MSLIPVRTLMLKEMRTTLVVLTIVAAVFVAVMLSPSHPTTQLAALLSGVGCGVLAKRLYGEFEWYRSNPTG